MTDFIQFPSSFAFILATKRVRIQQFYWWKRVLKSLSKTKVGQNKRHGGTEFHFDSNLHDHGTRKIQPVCVLFVLKFVEKSRDNVEQSNVDFIGIISFSWLKFSFYCVVVMCNKCVSALKFSDSVNFVVMNFNLVTYSSFTRVRDLCVWRLHKTTFHFVSSGVYWDVSFEEWI